MDTRRIERFASRLDAELACSALTAHGFNARVSGDDAAGAHPDVAFAIGGTAVVVPEAEYDDAVALLEAEFEGALDDESDDAVHVGDQPDGPGADEGRTMRRRLLHRAVAVLFVAAIAVSVLRGAGDVFGWL